MRKLLRGLLKATLGDPDQAMTDRKRRRDDETIQSIQSLYGQPLIQILETLYCLNTGQYIDRDNSTLMQALRSLLTQLVEHIKELSEDETKSLVAMLNWHAFVRLSETDIRCTILRILRMHKNDSHLAELLYKYLQSWQVAAKQHPCAPELLEELALIGEILCGLLVENYMTLASGNRCMLYIILAANLRREAHYEILTEYLQKLQSHAHYTLQTSSTEKELTRELVSLLYKVEKHRAIAEVPLEAFPTYHPLHWQSVYSITEFITFLQSCTKGGWVIQVDTNFTPTAPTTFTNQWDIVTYIQWEKSSPAQKVVKALIDEPTRDAIATEKDTDHRRGSFNGSYRKSLVLPTTIPGVQLQAVIWEEWAQMGGGYHVGGVEYFYLINHKPLTIIDAQ